MSGDLSIVVNGRPEAVLLDRLLDVTRSLEARFYAAEGNTALVTMARNILVHEGGPVLVVHDAATLDARQAAEKVALSSFAISSVAAAETFAVFAFVPQVEVMLFEAPSMLQRNLPEFDASGLSLKVGLLSPRPTLEGVLAGRGIEREEFYRSLTPDDIRKMSTGPQASAFLSAVDGLIAAGAVSEAA